MHESFNTQVEVQAQIFIWSDFPDGSWPWSDFPDTFYLWSDFPDIEGLWSDFSDRRIRPSSDHGPDSNSDTCPDHTQTLIRLECARSGYDQTQLRSKHLWSDPGVLAAIYDQTEARSKLVLIRLECARNTLIRNWFYL